MIETKFQCPKCAHTWILNTNTKLEGRKYMQCPKCKTERRIDKFKQFTARWDEVGKKD